MTTQKRIINYIILVHKNPRQVQRLVSRLAEDGVHFYLHVDQKCRIEDFTSIIPEIDHISYIKNRVDCRWGDVSIVDAIFNCYREIDAEGQTGHCVLLSGQDYPLRGGEYIRDFLESHPDHNFINIYPIPDPKKKSEGGGMERLISYTFDCRNPKNKRMKAKIQPLSVKPKTILGFFRIMRYRRDILGFACRAWLHKRGYPKDLAMCFNEMWMALNMNAVEYLLEVWNQHPEYRDYYLYTHVPDETVFGAILMANEKMRESIRPMLHYICWGGGKNGSPKILGMEDVRGMIERLRAGELCSGMEESGMMFARKFGEDDKVLDYIDDEIEAGREDH